MKIFITIITIIISLLYIHSASVVSNVEKEIYRIYENNFQGYLYFDDNSNLKFDEKKLLEDLKRDQIDINIITKENKLIFDISSKCLIRQNKKIEFYIEKNYGFE